MKKLALILLFTGLSISNMQSQVIDKYSFSFKSTLNILNSTLYEAAEINLFSKSYVWTIGHYFDIEQHELFSEYIPIEEYNQVNVFFGKYHDDKDDHLRLQYQAGISWLWTELRTNQEIDNGHDYITEYTTRQVRTIGIPFKAGFRYIPFKFLSIGLDLHANLNFEKNIFTGAFVIEIGKLR